jgi:hypothetical protein
MKRITLVRAAALLAAAGVGAAAARRIGGDLTHVT